MKKTIITLFLVCQILSYSSLSWADKPDSSSKGLASLFNSIVNGNIEFPKRFTTQAQPPLKNPDISLFVQTKLLSATLTSYLKHPLALGKDKTKPVSTLQAEKVLITPVPERNVLRVFIKGGILNLSQSYAGMEGKLVITNAEFEVFPQISKTKENQVVLEARLRLVHLDIDQTAPVVDKGIASLLQDLYFNDQKIKALNLSEDINKRKGLEHLDLSLVNAAVVMKKEGIEIQTTWNVSPEQN